MEHVSPAFVEICGAECPGTDPISSFNRQGLSSASRRQALGSQALTRDISPAAQKIIEEANDRQAAENANVSNLNRQPCQPEVDETGCRICPRVLLGREIGIF